MSKVKVTTLANAADTNSAATDDIIDGRVTAWVNFDQTAASGTGSSCIRNDFNVSTITDNGTFDFTVNFSAAMSDNDYAWSGSSSMDSVAQTNWLSGPSNLALETYQTTNGFRVQGSYANATKNSDSKQVCIIVVGGK